MMLECKLTPQQEDQVRWALDAMHDYARATESDGSPVVDFGPDDLPRVEKHVLKMPNTKEGKHAAEDLLYRLEIQLPDMAVSEPYSEVGGDLRAADNAADKIREMWPVKLKNR